MPRVRLAGQLICADAEEAEIVRRHLPDHLVATRAEQGCLSFEVTPTADPLVWQVAEVFADAAAFEVHQRRMVTSPWGRATAKIERRYTVEDIARPET